MESARRIPKLSLNTDLNRAKVSKEEAFACYTNRALLLGAEDVKAKILEQTVFP